MQELLNQPVTEPEHKPDTLLTRLVRRLEAATSRLEDIASSTSPFAGSPQQPAAGAGASAVPPTVQAFDELMDGELKEFLRLSEALAGKIGQHGRVIGQQAAALARAFKSQRQFLLLTTRAKKPDPDASSQVYTECLKDLQRDMGAVKDIRESYLKDPQRDGVAVKDSRDANREPLLKNHLDMLVAGAEALGWIMFESKPADDVSELLGGAQLYGNRVLKEYKDKDRTHVEWTQAFYKTCKALIAYIKEHYAMGLTWNNRDGIDAVEALRQVKAVQSAPNGPAAATGGLPPPPPPLPNFDIPPPTPPNMQSSRSPPSGDMGAIFDELNKGEAITSGLRKVDKSQMTHKNPSLRTSAIVPSRSDSSSPVGRSKSPVPPGKKPKPDNMRTKKPERKELDGNKWIIENFESPSAPVEIDASLSHSILISRCKSTTVRIHGKANAVSIDSSARVALILDSLVSSVDVIKCPHFALQVFGTLPTVMLDQVDGATLYLGKDSLNTEIFTSKCSGVNVNLPRSKATDEDDFREFPLPEQIRTFVRDGHLVSEIVEHAG